MVGEKTYQGTIGNVSEEGISSTVTTYIKTDDMFFPQKNIRLFFELPSGEEVELTCEVRWYLRPKPDDVNIILGLFILDPPPEYTAWINKFK